MSVHKKSNGTWFVRYRVPGEKNARSEYIGVGPDAEKLARARDREIKEQKASDKRPSDKLYLDQLAQAYLCDRKLAGKSPDWLEEMETLFNKRFLPELCHAPVDGLTYSDVMNMAEKHLAEVKLATRQRYLGYLYACFNYGTRHELTAGNPLSTWKKQPEPRTELLLTVEDLEKLYQCAAPHLQWAIAVEWEVGARPGPSELYAIKWLHVDFKRCLIRIPGTKTVLANRLIPITPAFCLELQKKREEAQSEYVIEFRGRGVKTTRTAFKRAQERAKLPYHVRMYDIRHLFVTLLLDGGAGLAAVSRMIGHSRIATTQEWYYHLLPGAMRDAMAFKPAPLGSRVADNARIHKRIHRPPQSTVKRRNLVAPPKAPKE